MMVEHLKKVPTWLRMVIFCIIVFGLAYLGTAIGATRTQSDTNTAQIQEIQKLQKAQRTLAINSAIAGCKAVLHSNQVFAKFAALLTTGPSAGDPVVKDLVAFLNTVIGDTELCDIAEHRVGHPITVPTTTSEGR